MRANPNGRHAWRMLLEWEAGSICSLLHRLGEGCSKSAQRRLAQPQRVPWQRGRLGKAYACGSAIAARRIVVGTAGFAAWGQDDNEETTVSVPLSLTVNGKAVTVQADPRTLLVQLIRDHLHLTGTHVGCDTAQCGACTVHLNGRAVKACSMLALQAQGGEVTTIEGLSANGALHPMQAAFRECHGLQCGFCTPGMVMSAVQLLNDKPQATEQEIREGLDGNICRCTGYHNIVKSIQLCQSGKAAATA
jgi:carbon-monoxide dehydrogenase small subunit